MFAGFLGILLGPYILKKLEVLITLAPTILTL
ncbi:hypothetical protein [Risungbinella massiliensis]